MRIRTKALVALLFFIFLVFNIFSITKYPPVAADEAWMNESAWNFLKAGNFNEPMFSGLIEFKNGYFAFGRLYLAIQAAVFKVFGLGFWQARLLSLVAGFVCLWLVYLIAARFYGQGVGLLATFLFALSGLFFFTAHNGRPEMLLTAAALLAFYLYVQARRKSARSLFFLTGLVAALSLDVHLNGVFLPLALAFFFIVDEKGAFWRSQFFWLFVSGATLGLIYWAAVHILPDAKLFLVQASNELNIKPHRALQISAEWKRYGGQYLFDRQLRANPLEAAFLLLALAYGAWKMTAKEAKLLIIIFAYVAVMAILIGDKSGLYLVTLLPFAYILLAKLLADIYSAVSHQPLLRIVSIALSTIIIVVFAGQIAFLTYEFRRSDYNGYVKRVGRLIPAKAVVMGQPVLWYGLADHPYYSTYYLQRVLADQKKVKDKLGHNFADVLRLKKVRYFIADSYYMDHQLRWHKKFRGRVIKYFRSHARLAGIVKDKIYGSTTVVGTGKTWKTRIYKIVNY